MLVINPNNFTSQLSKTSETQLLVAIVVLRSRVASHQNVWTLLSIFLYHFPKTLKTNSFPFVGRNKIYFLHNSSTNFSVASVGILKKE